MEASTHSQPERLRLVSELREVLDDLENNLKTYRLALVANFEHRYQQTLRDVEPVVAGEISQSLAHGIESEYPALAPDLKAIFNHQGVGRAVPHVSNADTLSTGRDILDNTSSHPHRPAADLDLDLGLARHQLVNAGSPLSPDAVFGAAATGVALSSGDPHEREKEFQGLFTPFFLPLLDSSAPLNHHLQPITSSPPRISTRSPSSQTADAANGIDSDFGSGKVNVGTADHLQVQAMEGPSETGAIRQALSDSQAEAKQDSPSPHLSRPSHGRTATDETLSSTLSSALSDKSDGTTARRSALRRSSSVSKNNQHSPRRVRFDFKGVEVLPTASPQPSDYLTPRPASPEAEDQPRSFDEIVGEDSRGLDDELANLAPPRKISSSEALRAMSSRLLM